ncbi:MAG: response regulator [Uliginosibacterium sp.]|nr:response regulator [Uliginosibacterium sp.]
MPSRPASPTVAVEPNSKCRVMVVDDDITTSTIIGAGLQRAGFQVFKAASGMACLEQIDQVEPEVLIIDIMMPEMDGYETCRRVRKTYGPEILSIIFLSGQDSLDDRLNAYEAGGDDFMSKPFSVKEVCRKIEAEVSLKHSWREYAKAARERESATAAVMDSLRESTVELSFTRRTLNCRTLQALAELATQSMSSYALTCHVQIRIPATTLTWTADGEACPPGGIGL